MNIKFPKFNMSNFSEQFAELSLIPLHATNPQPFTQTELEKTIGQSFNEIIQEVNLGFATDQGNYDLRESIANNLFSCVNPNEVVAHAGAQEALFCFFCALLKRNDKVLIVVPIFEPLEQIPINLGCEVDYINLNHNDNWSLDLNQVEAQFKMGCKLFVINFPHNPTGSTLSVLELNEIVELCKKYNVWLLSDEVFRGLEHELKHRLPAVADIYEKGISVGVISKALAVPGLRIGWLASKNQALIQSVISIKGYLSICNSQIDELLVATILSSKDKLLMRNLNIINANKKLLKSFNKISGQNIQFYIPNAGCCFFAELVEKNDPEKLVKKIAIDHGYLLYPSSLFKTNVNGMRIGFGSKSFSQFLNKINPL